MRNKGAIWTLVIALTLVCVYQLLFTFKANQVRRDADAHAQGNMALKQGYLDSIGSEVVFNFLGLRKYTYKECQEREINLGLDLQGGMNVILEVSVEDVIRSLSNHSKDTTFNRALILARQMQKGQSVDFVTLFGRAFQQVDPNARLSAIFTTQALRDKIEYNTPNDKVLDIIREEANSAIDNSFNIIRTRIDHFGVAQPNVQRLEGGELILVELPGAQDKDRIRKLLQGQARLEFWESYDNTELSENLMEANKVIKEYLEAQKVMARQEDKIPADTLSLLTEVESTAVDQEEALQEPTLLSQLTDSAETPEDATLESFNLNYPLFQYLRPMADQERFFPGSAIGRAQFRDTSKVNQYMRVAVQRNIFPKNIRFFWSAVPEKDPQTQKLTDIIELHAIKVTTRDGSAPLTGDAVTRAREGYDEMQGTAHVTMSMDGEGTTAWARITRDNVGRNVIIALDDMVYSSAVVREEISTGSTQISGNFSIKDAQDLANLLKSGTMPARCLIISEEIIGPSLGQKAINSGLNSFLVAFLVILLYMIFYYSRKAGLVANIALVSNMFFLIGVLASFGPALTLPGIAGIVLTIGMSVDANVLIFERIREEIAGGKGIRLAIADGYKNAYSAILDANLTTLITGIILFTLGTGPIKGFATTLVIGICTSLFSAIFITRLIFEIFLNKNSSITFSTKLTEGAFKNSNINFLGLRKQFYVVSAIAIVLCLGSLFTRGLDQGVDFVGGRNYIIQFDKSVIPSDIAAILEDELGERPKVITFGSDNQVRITTRYRIDDSDENVEQEIQEMVYRGLLPVVGEGVTYDVFYSKYWQGTQKVGPSIADDIKRQAVIALVVALVFMFLYMFIRFRNWQFGVGAVAALMHDAIIVLGLFSFLYGRMPFSLEIDQAFIAAILTVVGYSINDTVVVFDRIREFRLLYPKRDTAETMNQALNSTISRTINTSMTTLVVLLTIFMFGGESIQGFVFALLIGIGVGTYSSLFIATPIVFDTIKKNLVKKTA